MSGKIKRHRFHGFHRFVVASASDIFVGITGFWNSAISWDGVDPLACDVNHPPDR